MEEISISKDVLPSVEEYGFEETVLGGREGSIRQYRNSTGLHAREYEGKFIIHRDNVDPRANPIGHIVKDSPETLLSFGAAAFLSQSKKPPDSSFDLLKFLLLFLSLNKAFAIIKRLLR